jgi:hypothetical protein
MQLVLVTSSGCWAIPVEPLMLGLLSDTYLTELQVCQPFFFKKIKNKK